MAEKKRNKPWYVEVQWEDSTIPKAGWLPHADVVNPAYRSAIVACTSVGFILADDKTGVALASSVHAAEVAGVTIIPRSQIKKVKRLR